MNPSSLSLVKFKYIRRPLLLPLAFFLLPPSSPSLIHYNNIQHSLPSPTRLLPHSATSRLSFQIQPTSKCNSPRSSPALPCSSPGSPPSWRPTSTQARSANCLKSAANAKSRAAAATATATASAPTDVTMADAGPAGPAIGLARVLVVARSTRSKSFVGHFTAFGCSQLQ